MYYYNLFMQGPGVYIPVLLFSLVITMLAYGAFPLLFSRARKKQISKKKFRLLCYGINLLVMIAFIAFGSKSSGGPYILWTWIFSSAGIRKLNERGVFNIPYGDSSTGEAKEKDEDISNVNNSEMSRAEQKNSSSNNKRNLTMDIVNLALLVLVLVLSIIGGENTYGYETEYGMVFLIGIFSVVLKIIDIIKKQKNTVITVVIICSLLLMFFACVGYDDGINVLIALCVLYLLIFELCQLFVKVILQKYHATQAYKIKCYKKIEQISTYCEKGIITEEEYEKARDQIMSKIRY